MKKLLLINAISFSLLAMNTERDRICKLRADKDYNEFVCHLGGNMDSKGEKFFLDLIEVLRNKGYNFQDLPGRVGSDNLLHTVVTESPQKLAPRIAQKLIDQGIDPNSKNEDGETCLGRVFPYVSEKQIFDLYKVLLKNGANPNEPIDDETLQTVLHRKNISPRIAQLLVEHGGDPRIKDEDGKTALDYQENEETKAIFQKQAAFLNNK